MKGLLFDNPTLKFESNWGGGGGGGSRGEQRRRGLRTKALMRDLGTRLECRQRVFVRTGKTLWKY